MTRDLIALFTLSACTGSGEPTPALGPDDSGDAPSDDTGGEVAAELPPCPPYSGIQSLHTTWSYFREDDGRSEWLDRTVESVSGEDVELRHERHIEEDDPGTDEISTLSYTCADGGMYLASVYTEITVGESIIPGGDIRELTIYDAPVLTLPSSLSVGDAWTTDMSYTFDRSTAEVEHRSVSATWTVADELSVEVSAGTFVVLKIEIGLTGDDGDETRTLYLNEEIGQVKAGGLKLTSYTP